MRQTRAGLARRERGASGQVAGRDDDVDGLFGLGPEGQEDEAEGEQAEEEGEKKGAFSGHGER